MNSRTEAILKMAKEATDILKERGEKYDNGKIEDNAHAYIMRTLFPGGMADDIDCIVRYKHVSHIVDKLCRYRLNIDKEHLLDIANYAFILAAYDEEQK